MMKHIALTLLICILWLPANSQRNDDKNQKVKTITVVFYNVENLFDTFDDPGFRDEEYLPLGIKEWTEERFRKKVDDIAEVLMSVDKEHLPAVIGLCEVENRNVLEHLVMSSQLEPGHYKIIHEDGPDERGIDVAFLYKPDILELQSYRTIRIEFPRDTITTRDILYVKGKADPGETFHFFVNHWKSRSGGVEATENKRITSAVILRRAVDSIISFDPRSHIVIMGDFNDEPTNISLNHFLQAGNKRKNAGPRDLYNLFYDMHNLQNTGTYQFRDQWNMLDQIIISQSLLDNMGYTTSYDGGKIFKMDFILYENPKANEKVPNRTYGGNTYFGGISDHLPVYVTFEWRGEH